jgi:hypothetical protein
MNLYKVLDKVEHVLRGKEAYLTQMEEKIAECKEKRLNAFTFCLAADILRLSVKELELIRKDVLGAINSNDSPR